MSPPIAPGSFMDLYKAIVSSKNEKIKGQPNNTKVNLITLEPQVSARYTKFESLLAKEKLFQIKEDITLLTHMSDLLSCYTGRTKKLIAVFDLIKQSQPKRFLSKCPYCGITIPGTYDHYLPESKFPELSVHALNLVPCCGTCNQKKNNIWKNHKHRTILHFYTDSIPLKQFIFVKLNVNKGLKTISAYFSMQRPNGINDDTWSILESHYDKLNLLGRYNDHVGDAIDEIRAVCIAHMSDGGKSVTNFLASLLKDDKELFGVNHWRVVLMDELSHCKYFVENLAK